MHLDLLYTATGAFVGLIVGLTGVGGGSLMTPLLVLALGVHPVTAVGTDLLNAAATKAVGALAHHRRNHVDWAIVARLSAGSVPAAALTLFALSHLGLRASQSSHLVTKVLGAALIITALTVFFRKALLRMRGAHKLSTRAQNGLTILVGAMIGVVVSISSVGAGAVGVTALLLLYPGLPLLRVIGTDIAHAVPLTLVAGMGHWMIGSVDVAMLVALLCGSVPGIIAGSCLAPRIPAGALRTVLAVVLLAVGFKMLSA
ncbi:MAG: sulfite exporter TauE/SafE family protein [Hyphomicrobiales bacterium]|nr:sulfite exporter TauE/SafE family protein [Hyphomicrobiales bacterium]